MNSPKVTQKTVHSKNTPKEQNPKSEQESMKAKQRGFQQQTGN